MDYQSEYLKLLEDLDKVLITLNNLSELTPIKKVLIDSGIKFEKEYSERIAKKLFSDGIVKMSRDSEGIDLEILPTGSDFILTGGYTERVKKEIEKEKRELKLIKTTIASNKTNIKLLKWNVGLAILNVALFIINLIIAYMALSND